MRRWLGVSELWTSVSVGDSVAAGDPLGRLYPSEASLLSPVHGVVTFVLPAGSIGLPPDQRKLRDDEVVVRIETASKQEPEELALEAQQFVLEECRKTHEKALKTVENARENRLGAGLSGLIWAVLGAAAFIWWDSPWRFLVVLFAVVAISFSYRETTADLRRAEEHAARYPGVSGVRDACSRTVSVHRAS